MSHVVQSIDRKLRLTAALLGVIARKDLAAAFRRANPNTAFDVVRADKWLHGRARPRELQVYEDWSRVLGLDRSGRWVADCSFDDFLAEVSARHGRDPEELLGQLDRFGGRSAPEGPGLSLAGTYVAYSHAWSPYFRGRLMRGALSVGASTRPDRLPVSYTEVLPTVRMQLDGEMVVDKRTLRIDVADATRTSQWLTFSLFPASPPVSVLGGVMCGATLLGLDAEPSMSRIVLIRLTAASARLRSAEAYLPLGASLGEDLRSLGLALDDAAGIDRCLTTFLTGGAGGGVDQVPTSGYRELVGLFDRLRMHRGSAEGAASLVR